LENAPPLTVDVLAAPTDAAWDVGRLFVARQPLEDVVGNVAREVAGRSRADCLVLLGDGSGLRLQVLGRADGPDGWGLHAGDAPYAALSTHLRSLDPATSEHAPWREVRRGDPFITDDAGAPELDPAWEAAGVGRLMALPLRKGRELLGLLVACRPPGAPPFGPTDAALFGTLAAEVSRGLATATLLAEERWQRQKAELMFQASKAIHTELQFDQAVREIALLLKQSIKAPWVGWLDLRPERDELGLMGSTLEPAKDLRLADAPWPLATWPDAREVFAEPLRLTKVSLPPTLAAAAQAPTGEGWAVPLMHKRKPLGLLVVTCSPGQAGFRPESQEVAVAIAELMALALSNHHLIEEEARARTQIIRAQAAAQEREVLLRQIVHDLRNATQAMSLVVEDMELGIGDNPQVHAGLGILNNQITFISNFLKEKLAWMAQGERPGAGEVARLSQVFAAMEDRYGPAARTKNQRLIVSPPEPVEVALSQVQLEQVLGNLLDNAIKFTQAHGEIRVRADVSDGWVTVYVSDTGPGIPLEVRPHLGEVGQRGHTSVEGAGLGLSNVRQLVTRAGGLFGCTSSETTGTTFHVSLPSTLWGRVIS
jgi:signal transduction histidine kinase